MGLTPSWLTGVRHELDDRDPIASVFRLGLAARRPRLTAFREIDPESTFDSLEQDVIPRALGREFLPCLLASFCVRIYVAIPFDVNSHRFRFEAGTFAYLHSPRGQVDVMLRDLRGIGHRSSF